MTKVVILGSNFAGLDAAIKLKRLDKSIEILVIDKSNAEYCPSLHKIISGSKFNADLQINLELLYSKYNIDFKYDTVKSIDTKKNIVLTKNGKYPFDYLINSLGAVSNYYGILGAEKHSIPFKSSKDSDTIKEKIINLDSKEKYTILVAGSGLTGVELIFEIKTYLKSIAKQADLHIIEVMPTIAPWANPTTQKFLKKIMAKDNISIHEGFQIAKVEKDYIHSKTNEKIEFDLLIWCAGLGVNPVITDSEFAKDGKGMIVDSELRSTSNKNIFGCGDAISIPTSPCPKTAHFALVESDLVAWNVYSDIHKLPLKKLTITPAPALVSLGKHGSIFVYKNILLKHPRWIIDLIKKSVEKWWIITRR